MHIKPGNEMAYRFTDVAAKHGIRGRTILRGLRLESELWSERIACAALSLESYFCLVLLTCAVSKEDEGRRYGPFRVVSDVRGDHDKSKGESDGLAVD